MATLSPEVVDKIREANKKDYKAQAVFFLNAAWHNITETQREEVYQMSLEFPKYDHEKGSNGTELNMTQSFALLQKLSKTMTALELKAQLRKVDIDANGEMALLEYLIFAFNQDATKVALAPQGSATPEEQAKLEAAEANMKALSKLFDELLAAQLSVEQLKAEAQVIAAEIKAQEDAKAALIAKLEATSTDQTIGIVKRNMAVQELAQAKNEDPLPLRKAKLTQDAVVRKLEKAVALAAEKTKDAEAALKKAEEEFEQLKATCSGIAHGSIWMLERDIKEKKRYLPQSRQ